MKFGLSNHWGGNCCGSSCYAKDTYGINVRFDQPWEDGEEGRTVATIETSVGNIYVKFNMDNKYHRLKEIYHPHVVVEPHGPTTYRDVYNGYKLGIYNDKIEHYSCKEIYENAFSAQVGLVIAADNYDEYIKTRDSYLARGRPDQAKAYEDYANLHKDEDKKVRDKLSAEGILLYESEPFYNLIHQNRVKPSLTFFVYDKGLKQ